MTAGNGDLATIEAIAHIRSPFATKFGVPRQSGLVADVQATVVFTPKYQSREAVRGLEGFDRIWLIWRFHQALRQEWSPTVRPPRLGGNQRVGVFATRSPFRPNALGLSAVGLEGIEYHPDLGPVLRISGADLVDGTPIFDIKPYVPYADSYPDSRGGFADAVERRKLAVEFPPELLECLPPEQRAPLVGVLRQDPRPSYQNDPDRVYGMDFAGYNVRFTVAGETLTVRSVARLEQKLK